MDKEHKVGDLLLAVEHNGDRLLGVIQKIHYQNLMYSYTIEWFNGDLETGYYVNNIDRYKELLEMYGNT